MRAWSPLTIGLAVGFVAALAVVGALVYSKLRRRKSPAELERLRRLFLSRSGRIVTGEIIGLVEPEGTTSLLLVYRYDVAGVTYEVSQDLEALPELAAHARHSLGGISTIRYEMNRPSNSIVASEEWSGLPEIKGEESAAAPPKSSSKAAEKQV